MIGVSQISVAAYRGGGAAAPVNLDFVSTWDTTKAGSASNTIVLPLPSAGTYVGTIDWGDGNSDDLSYANRTHVYATSGIYTITITSTVFDGGIYFNNGGDKLKILNISNWGNTINYSITGQRAFQGCSNMNITAIDAPIISTTNMREFFSRCVSLTTPDFSSWDTSMATTMLGMFYNCTNFNGNVSTWDVSNVASFGSTANFSGMFEACSIFNQNISGWNVSNALNMTKMFSNAILFNQNLSSWDINQVTNFTNFMVGVTLSTVNYDALLIDWDAQGAMSYSGTVNFGGSQYTSGGAADAARTSLIAKWGGITDGGAA
jgi:trimeric autotransporter adhesin